MASGRPGLLVWWLLLLAALLGPAAALRRVSGRPSGGAPPEASGFQRRGRLEELIRLGTRMEPARRKVEMKRWPLPPGSESSATSGHEFEMKKVRSWPGGGRGKVAFQRRQHRDYATGCNSTRWAVTTTIFSPSEAAKYMQSAPGWCMVVVGDRRGPPGDSYLDGSPSVAFLSAARQEELLRGFASFARLPWHSFGRKNLGFLFAISQGAETIFDFDDDNMPLPGSPSPLAHGSGPSCGVRTVAPQPASLVANVYPLFVAEGLPWPRGFPLRAVRPEAFGPAEQASVPRWSSSQLDRARIGVEQTLAQHNPDVDAIYRMTQRLPLDFRRDDVPVALEPGVYSPFNAQATFWSRPAFLALLLPVTVSGRVSDILRSYVAQLILWERGLRLVFSGPQVEVTSRNAHNLMGDFESEWPLYYKSAGLVEGLEALRRNQTAAQRASGRPQELFLDIYVFLYEHGIVEKEDVLLAEAWVEDLGRAGLDPC